MATIAKQAVEWVKTRTGGPPIVGNYPEASGQSFKLGEPVYLVDGKVTICGTNPGVILGFALHDASATADTNVQVVLAEATNVFAGNLSGSTVTAQSQVGKSYGITAASEKWHVDTSKTGTNARVLIERLDPRDTVGDTAGRVYFMVLSKYRQLDVSS